MQFLKTFFGQMLRKADMNFMQESVRDGIVNTHADITNGLGGVVEGLNVYKSDDSLSLIVTPGTFYNSGPVSNINSVGGGERGKLYNAKTFINLANTENIGNEATCLVVYANTINQTHNPDPKKSQAIVSSKNTQTGENVPIRIYTNAIISISNPVKISQINKIKGTLLATVTVSNNVITSVDTSVKKSYVIGGVVDVQNKTVTTGTLDYIISRVQKTPLENITSTGISAWDGVTAYNSLSGSGIAHQHLKHGAVTSNKIHPVSGLNNFSIDNYIFNGSFDILDHSDDASVLTGWNTWIEADGSLEALTPFGAAIEKTTDEFYNRTYSVKFSGVDSSQIAALNPSGLAGLSIWQDIYFSGNKINNIPVMASLYMKTSDVGFDSDSGLYGIQANIQFLNAGTGIDSPFQLMDYTGAAVDWTRFGLLAPVKYNTDPNIAIDGVRLTISGTISSATTAYFDNVYFGLTDIEPTWEPSQADIDYSDVLVKKNITADNIQVNTDLVVSSVSSVAPGSFLGSGVSVSGLANPLGAIYTDSVYTSSITLNGSGISQTTNKFKLFTAAGAGAGNKWTVPDGIYSIEVTAVGGGGGGSAGASQYSYQSGGGGGGGEWVKTWLAVTPGTQLQINVGFGGGGGGPTQFGEGLPGGNGSPTTIYVVGSPSVLLASAAGGSAAVNNVNGGIGGGVNSISSNMIRLKGQDGIIGNPAGVSFAGGGNGGDTHIGSKDIFGAGGAGGGIKTPGAGGNYYGAGGGGGGAEAGSNVNYGDGGQGGGGANGGVLIYY